MRLIILYDTSDGETMQDAKDYEWFANMSIKDYDGSEPEIGYPDIEIISEDDFWRQSIFIVYLGRKF